MEERNWLNEVYTHIDEHFESTHLPRVTRLVQQPSIAGTGEGIYECAELVIDLLAEIGCENIHLEHYVRSPIVEGTLHADVPGAPAIIMYGMYDVQPPEPLEEWTVEPFAGTIKEYPPYGECMVARGVANSKGPLVCFINAVESMKKVLGYMPLTIRFVVEGEEELGSESMIQYMATHADEMDQFECCFLNGTRQDEKGRPFTILGCKGILYMDLECTGGDWGGPSVVDVHSMNAAWLSSPTWRLINALATMRDSNDNILIDGFYDDVPVLSEADEALTQRMIDVFDEPMFLNDRLIAKRFMKGWSGGDALRNLLWKPTLNIDGIQAGYNGPATKTVLPYKATCKIDIRLVPPMRPEPMLEKFTRHLEKHGFGDIKITVRQGSLGNKVDPTCLSARACIAAMDDSGYPDGSPWPIFPGTGPGYLFGQAGLPYVSYGLGQSGRIHAPDEWFTVRGMRENEHSNAAFLYYLLKLWHEERQKQA